MYYNARYYDPGIGRFVSANTIIPDRFNPQARNRYSYVYNNPQKYVDPSGHCVEGYDETLADCEDYLARNGWNVMNLSDWTYDKLFLFAESILDLKRAAGWDADAYKGTMSRNGQFERRLVRGSLSENNSGTPAETQETKRGSVLTLRVFNSAFLEGATSSDIKNILVHEQAHVWDIASGNQRSAELQARPGNTYREDPGVTRLQDAPPTSYAQRNAVEDWAETVAVSVHKSKAEVPMGPQHRAYATNYLPCTYGVPVCR